MPKKTKRRGTPRRAQKKAAAPRRPRTALVRRVENVQVLEPGPDLEERRIVADDIVLGDLGLVEIKFTPAEEAVLAESVRVEEVQVKPTGGVYLPHPVYTRWFNRAFGRGGWGLVPASKPMKADKSVICPYVLFIHGKPAAFAMGEQDYFESNKDQSYGDALESTVASAMRRCAKRLGVGLELWDRSWGDRWLAANAVKVWVSKKQQDGTSKNSPAWRRIDAPAFYNEAGQVRTDGRDEPQAETRRTRAPAREVPHTHAQSGAVITNPQRQRLGIIIRNSGRDVEDVQQWIERVYNHRTSETITRDEYDAICRAIEASGDLPERRR